MTTSDPIHPYGSANDLPSFQDMEQQIEAFKVLSSLVPNFDDSELQSLEENRNSIVRRVDAFYDLLGRRNWVFTGDLSLKEMDSVIASPDAEGAEERLIAYYQQANRLELPVQQLARFDAMRPRLTLIQNALNDYNEGRYYSCVLVLIAMMDGFVSDFDADSNKGLHARPAEGMVAWDSVVGHHLGLSHAHASFTKGFYKTRTEEIHELSRNGIMHGMLVNFDNEVVATKAWNRLFAIADWADSKVRLEAPAEPQPEIDESLRQLAVIAAEREKMELWGTYSCLPGVGTVNECDAGRACLDFLQRWQARQWALVGGHFIRQGKKESVGKIAERAKDLYSDQILSSWTIASIEHTAPAITVIGVELVVNEVPASIDWRWVRIDADGSSVSEWTPGNWTLTGYGPSLFLTT